MPEPSFQSPEAKASRSECGLAHYRLAGGPLAASACAHYQSQPATIMNRTSATLDVAAALGMTMS